MKIIGKQYYNSYNIPFRIIQHFVVRCQGMTI